MNTSLQWPTGLGGKGNEGVAAMVSRTDGAIGYVEYAYAKKNKMAYAQMKNQAGKFVAPDNETFQSAAASADWCKSPAYDILLTNQPGDRSWPITGATFILVYEKAEKPRDPAAAARLLRLGLSERRQDGGRARLRADAGQGRRPDREDMEAGQGPNGEALWAGKTISPAREPILEKRKGAGTFRVRMTDGHRS